MDEQAEDSIPDPLPVQILKSQGGIEDDHNFLPLKVVFSLSDLAWLFLDLNEFLTYLKQLSSQLSLMEEVNEFYQDSE